MTPQERQLVDELFDKLAQLETAPRDADAAATIAAGSRRAPNALYALVQTVLLQDEALKRANEHIQQLESGGQNQQPPGGFLDSMRDTLFGGGGSRGSVPNVRPADANSRGPMWNSGQALGQPSGGYGNGGYTAAGYGGPGAVPGGPAPAAGGGGSFLGTAAAAAAGMIGGSLLMNSMRGMFGGSGQQHGFGDQASLGNDKSASPWGGNDASGSDLARDAGLNDIGKGANAGGGDTNSRQGFFDQASNDEGHDEDDDDFDSDDDSSDFGGGGDSDYA